MTKCPKFRRTAGWYRDSSGKWMRYFDGKSWTGEYAPANASRSPSPLMALIRMLVSALGILTVGGLLPDAIYARASRTAARRAGANLWDLSE